MSRGVREAAAAAPAAAPAAGCEDAETVFGEEVRAECALGMAGPAAGLELALLLGCSWVGLGGVEPY